MNPENSSPGKTLAEQLPIVVLSGFIGAGKDAVATIMERDYGYMRYAFAGPLRKTLERLDPWVHIKLPPAMRLATHHEQYAYVRLTEALRMYEGWDNLKRANPVEIRELMQKQGHLCRDIFGRECWAHALARQVSEELFRQAYKDSAPYENRLMQGILISDRRQVFEDEAFKDKLDTLRMPFVVESVTDPIRVWVDRPGLGVVNNADSEQFYDQLREQAIIVVKNHGTTETWLEELEDEVADLVAKVNKKLTETKAL